jgi:hypothetical protein
MSIDAMKQVLAVMDTVAPSVEASAPRYYAARDALRAAIEQAPWVKTYSGGQPNYTEPLNRKPVAWRKHYENSGYTYFDERWKTIPNDAEPLFSD